MFLLIILKHIAGQDPPWLSLPPAEFRDTEFDAAMLSMELNWQPVSSACPPVKLKGHGYSF